MKIKKTTEAEESSNRVVLVRKGQELASLLPDKEQRLYVEGRF